MEIEIGGEGKRMTMCERRRRGGGRIGSKVMNIVCDQQDGQKRVR